MDSRVDGLLAELASRYSLTERFLAELRPTLVTILADEQLSAHRTHLLEQVAETCQRDQELRRAFAALRRSLQQFFARLVREAEQGKGKLPGR
ncbi:MAG: hypothetical protein HY812_03185 [Planctomycetes bacterium]|nr:hypothetical protein [Planctomycetota bacterium]